MSIHWGRVTHICVSKITIIGPHNGLLPERHHAIIWTNAGILLIGPWGTNFSEILIEIYTFSFKKMHLKMSSGKWLPSCLNLNVLRNYPGDNPTGCLTFRLSIYGCVLIHHGSCSIYHSGNPNDSNACRGTPVCMNSLLMHWSYCSLWMKRFVFWLKFNWILFLRVQFTITQHWFR